MAFAVREYASTIMSVLALVISAMSFYLTNFAKPEDLRVTIYAPNIRTDGSDLEFTAENELNILLGEPIKENIVPIENENAKSYKMTITQDFVFINSGREPILVSAVYV